MRLLRNLLHIEPLRQPRTAGGILLLDAVLPQQYRVLAAGPGKRLKDGSYVPLEIQPGDCVLCPAFSDTKHAFDDGSLIVPASEVVAVWR